MAEKMVVVGLGRPGLGVVQVQPALAGSISTAARLAGVKSDRTVGRCTRRNGTHNRFFAGLDALLATLLRVFAEMQSHPQLIPLASLLSIDPLCPFHYARLQIEPEVLAWRSYKALADHQRQGC